MVVDSSPILVVANPEEGDAIRDLLSDAGFDNIALVDGGDETVTTFDDVAPHVVVVAVGLPKGDAKQLIAAMRERGARRPMRVVLIGEEDGPIRNALDATDFAVDRFVGRPLSTKALAFAVTSCARVVNQERRELEAADAPQGGVAVAATASSSPDPEPVFSPIMEQAIDAFVRDAIDAMEDTIALHGSPARAPAAVDAEAWDAPPLPVREPTLILSGGGAGSPPPPPLPINAPSRLAASAAAPQVIPPETTEPQTSRPWDEVGPLSEDDDLAELGGHVDAIDDLDDQLAEFATSDGDPAGRSDISGGNFARQLRQKMSAMAERLFPADAKVPAEAPLHDVPLEHRTEVDFIGLDAGGHGEPGHAADELAVGDSEPVRASTGTSPRADSTDARVVDMDAQTTSRTQSTDIRRRGELGHGADGIAAAIATVWGDELSGRMILKRSHAEKVIYFEKGLPVFATSNLTHDRMGALLYREGKITAEQHAKSRDVVAESGRRMGEILIEMGFLKRRELLPAVRRHIEDIIYSLFAWTDGEYIVVTGGSASGEKIRLSRHPAALVMEGIRRKYGHDRLENAVGTQSAIIAITSDEALKVILGAADLSSTERAALRSFDGEQTLEQVAGRTGIDLLLAYQLGYGLVVLGAAEIRRRGDDRDAELDFARAPELVGETDLTIDRQRVLAKHALVGDADYFTLLGVRRNASSFEIQRAYESARRDYATDSFPSAVQLELGAEIGEINELLVEAYHILKDRRLRQSYLTNLRE